MIHSNYQTKINLYYTHSSLLHEPKARFPTENEFLFGRLNIIRKTVVTSQKSIHTRSHTQIHTHTFIRIPFTPRDLGYPSNQSSSKNRLNALLVYLPATSRIPALSHTHTAAKSKRLTQARKRAIIPPGARANPDGQNANTPSFVANASSPAASRPFNLFASRACACTCVSVSVSLLYTRCKNPSLRSARGSCSRTIYSQIEKLA